MNWENFFGVLAGCCILAAFIALCAAPFIPHAFWVISGIFAVGSISAALAAGLVR